MGIQTGTSELDELLDVIESYRTNGMAAEMEERHLLSDGLADSLKTNANTSVSISNRKKRRANSTAELASSESRNTCHTVTRKKAKKSGNKAKNR